MTTQPHFEVSLIAEDAFFADSANDRERIIAERCGGDAGLLARVRARVNQLLQHEHVACGYPRLDSNLGNQIGPYRILEKVGEGGFGVVYLAERREPMVQRVALKIIKPGMDSKAVIARFEQERQALAMMDHPNVAKVLDGGVTPSGLPYFVMEHVKGESITTFADRHRLTIKERLELFVPVCEAVQHAHMKGIIHRDIKPSNILVAPLGDERSDDAAATHGMLVKVIDFGVAKAISHTLTNMTIFTERGQFIGTPEYMSPEQAEMGPTDVDTRTDVYSLGVVLYQLLSDTLPFDPKALRSAGFAEIQRIIREVDPPTPSARVSARPPIDGPDRTGVEPGQLTSDTVAARRQTEPHKLGLMLRGDLDWIVMKSLEKDRRRRYDTPNNLAADVSRHLGGEPVLAAPPSMAYRVRKFVRRHRGLVAAVTLVVSTLLIGLIGTTSGVVWALSERSKAKAAAESERRVVVALQDSETQSEARRIAAEARSATLRQLATNILFDAQARAIPLRGGVRLREYLISLAADHLQGLAADASTDETPTRELAQGFSRLGSARGDPGRISLGDYEGAAQAYRRSIDLYRELQATDRTDSLRSELASCYLALGRCEAALGRKDDARAAYTAATALAKASESTDIWGLTAAAEAIYGCVRDRVERLPLSAERLEELQQLLDSTRRSLQQTRSDWRLIRAYSALNDSLARHYAMEKNWRAARDAINSALQAIGARDEEHASLASLIEARLSLQLAVLEYDTGDTSAFRKSVARLASLDTLTISPTDETYSDLRELLHWYRLAMTGVIAKTGESDAWIGDFLSAACSGQRALLQMNPDDSSLQGELFMLNLLLTAYHLERGEYGAAQDLVADAAEQCETVWTQPADLHDVEFAVFLWKNVGAMNVLAGTSPEFPMKFRIESWRKSRRMWERALRLGESMGDTGEATTASAGDRDAPTVVDLKMLVDGATRAIEHLERGEEPPFELTRTGGTIDFRTLAKTFLGVEMKP